MSYKRIKSFVVWLFNKCFSNLIRLPIKSHVKCVNDGVYNLLTHIIWIGVIIFSFGCYLQFTMAKDDWERHNTIGYWDFVCIVIVVLHYVYCLIAQQYGKYLSEISATMERLK